MAEFALIREEGDGYARRLVVRLPEREWEAQPGQKVRLEVVENVVLPPEERV